MDDVFARYGVDPRLIADELGVSREAVRLWRAGGSSTSDRPTKRLSAQNAIAIEKKFGIPRHELRPDLWSPPNDPQPVTKKAAADGRTPRSRDALQRPA